MGWRRRGVSREMADRLELIEMAVPQLELMRELHAADRLLAVEGMEAELLRRTARAAFEDWFEARVRAQINERKGQTCLDVRTVLTRQ